MRLHPRTRPARLLAGLACLPVLIAGCGRPSRTVAVGARAVRVALPADSAEVARPANPFGAGSLALAVRTDEQKRWILVVAEAAVSSHPTPPAGGRPAVSASGAIDWPCVAIAETGGDVTWHGPIYSTEYGVVNSIVTQYATPEVAARVFAGTASEAEQTDIVARFAADHGTSGWGTLTKAKCGL